MGTSFVEVLNSFKREWTKYLDCQSINLLAKELGVSWRSRKLDPGKTLILFLLQILHGNTAIKNLPHLSGIWFQASSYCKARMRLPLSLFENLFLKIQSSYQSKDFKKGTWLGHRVFLGDGTGVSMPDVKSLKAEFDYPHRQIKECSFPVAKLLVLMHFGTGLISKVSVSPLYTGDMKQYPELRTELKEGDILVADRAACAYHHISQLLQKYGYTILLFITIHR